MNDKTRSTNLSGKTKIIAIVLAIFFGLFAWLYTYKKSAKKFWIAFGILLLFIILYYTPIPGWFFISIFTYLFGFSSWLWALIDTSTKPDSFFENYPNG